MKNKLLLQSVAKTFLNNLRNENDEPMCTYNGEYLRWFSRQSIKGGRCSFLNQYYKSIISDEVFKKSQKR